jgi:hypothetical protein
MQVHEQTYKPHGIIERPVCKGSAHEHDQEANRYGRPVMKELPTPTLDLSPLKMPRRWTFPKPVFGAAVEISTVAKPSKTAGGI